MTGSRLLIGSACLKLLPGVATLLLSVATLRAETEASEEPKRPERVWANSRAAWIYEKPRLTPNGVGYLRAGASVALKVGEPVPGPGCAGGWYAVEPGGYICDDWRIAFEPTRYVSSMAEASARRAPLPFHYALSNHAPMYRRLPTPAEWQQHERYLGEPGTFGQLSWGNRGHEKLAEVRSIEPNAQIPAFFRDGGSVSRRQARGVLRRMIPLGSMLAYTRSFEHAGRTWLFSADGTVVPADRVRPFRESQFRGVGLAQQTRLPLAWIKSEPKAQYVTKDAGGFEKQGHTWQVRQAVQLQDAPPSTWRGQRYWKSTLSDERGRTLFVRESDASIVQPREKLPWGIAADEKWLSISITRGVLVAYRGLEPVFTTLVSPGAGGVPVEGRDPVKWSTTPMGRYRVTFKHLAADMSPDHGEQRRSWIADVPYTQYFSPPFAIHVAYWHENFGDPMSAGCINVSPRDGQWLFGWTGPRLPKGWNGIGPSAFSGKGTVIIVTR